MLADVHSVLVLQDYEIFRILCEIEWAPHRMQSRNIARVLVQRELDRRLVFLDSLG